VCVRAIDTDCIIPRSANRSRFEPACLDSPAQSGNGLFGWELCKRVGQHKAKAQDTFPYLASASLYAGAFSCG
jgi:hypothetical protein